MRVQGHPHNTFVFHFDPSSIIANEKLQWVLCWRPCVHNINNGPTLSLDHLHLGY